MDDLAASCKVYKLRISVIAGESFSALIDDWEGYPYGFIARPGPYKAHFEDARTVRSPSTPPRGLGLPWKEEAGSNFWRRYLDSDYLGMLKSSRAWSHNVPFRHRPNANLMIIGEKHVRIFAECFFYPFGLMQVLTIELSNPLALPEMVDYAVELVDKHRIDFTWEDQAQGELTLNALRIEMLKRHRRLALGQTPVEGKSSSTPFTVATVISGDEQLSQLPVNQDGTVHRALAGLVSWKDNWKETSPLPKLEEHQLPIGRQEANDLLYHHRRGRAVWFPRKFRSDQANISSLSCYHRNLVLAAAQVEMLGLFCAQSHQRMFSRQDLSPTHKALLRKALVNLRNLHAATATYRSRSAGFHIENNEWFDGLTELWEMEI